ncbi:DMT family transporter [Levilactobacillus namurensis]|uniref:DMT family transporter n=1 Tax=Levilactobacillus namurensis TaxID=380393 RepID=UPI00222E7873|nr:DMT family transporter [Levilactobacillus namurensis]MCW3779369.1 DMT family transporter [Levilactobacillus namurensis]MDT7017781.1 DMT family transporter [Levilactobacillus namurensis]WNN65218.1 DMT family transporter [Levilactobacillus namurensis]
MQQREHLLKGHLVALLTIFLWGITYISTKILLTDFAPLEILLIRFVIGLVGLFLVYPRFFKFTSWKEEGALAAAGLLGICLYYLFENIALTFTYASNIGVIVSTSPLFIALIAAALGRQRLTKHFVLGFVASMAGISLISLNGSGVHINVAGDVLALLAALIWALYSYVVSYLNTLGHNPVQVTRRTFIYGIIFILPVFFATHGQVKLGLILQSQNLVNFLFLGLGASALCFLSWAYAVKKLGTVKTSIYIYLVPVVTVVTAWLILHEPITPLVILGILLTIGGLVVSARQ